MSVKLADTLAPMGEFPVAEGKNIVLTKTDGTEKSIQNMYDDGELSGSGSSIFYGTKAEWEELTPEEKKTYDYAAFGELVSLPKGFLVVAQDGTGDFTSVSAALDAIPNGGDVQIYLKAGNYNEVLDCDARFNSVTIIGESRERCRIYNESGVYKNSPLKINGNFVLRHLTFEMSLNAVGSWVPTYTSDVENTYPGYACHIDGQSLNPSLNAYGEVVDCVFISNAFPAVGMGVNNHQHVEFRNCQFSRTTTDPNYKRDNWRGSFLCHASNSASDTECVLTLKDNTFYSVYGYAAHIRSADLAGDANFILEAVNNRFSSAETMSSSEEVYSGRCYYTKGNSTLRYGYGNSDDSLNTYGKHLMVSAPGNKQFAGYYWPNGQKVYRSLITHGPLSPNQLLTVDLTPLKISAPVKFSGAAYDGATYWYPLCYGEYGDNHLSYSAFYNAISKAMFIRSQGISISAGNIIIEYLAEEE